MDKIDKYFSSRYFILNISFGAVFSLPLTLGGLLFAMAQGVTAAEDGVIYYIALLLVFDVIYLILYKFKRYPKWIYKVFLITDKNKKNSAENVHFDNNYQFDFSDKPMKNPGGIERETIINLANIIVYKKIICRLALVLTLLSFIVFSFLQL
jgi:hypothetical protein